MICIYYYNVVIDSDGTVYILVSFSLKNSETLEALGITMYPCPLYVKNYSDDDCNDLLYYEIELIQSILLGVSKHSSESNIKVFDSYPLSPITSLSQLRYEIKVVRELIKLLDLKTFIQFIRRWSSSEFSAKLTKTELYCLFFLGFAVGQIEKNRGIDLIDGCYPPRLKKTIRGALLDDLRDSIADLPKLARMVQFCDKRLLASIFWDDETLSTEFKTLVRNLIIKALLEV